MSETAPGAATAALSVPACALQFAGSLVTDFAASVEASVSVSVSVNASVSASGSATGG